VEFSGDIEMYVPEDAKGDVDEALWMIHKGMVEEAQQSRAKFLQVMATLAGHLMSSLTFKS
jgi:primosomal replication protein N